MTFLWHDYETFGTHPAHDRPSQFAAIRTDGELNPVEEPMTWFSRPSRDSLPHPMACLVTGITPQRAEREGMNEVDFAKKIHSAMMVPGTCSAGYNSIRFDDEMSRFLFYRNFLDPYEREWRNGNSRWDLIDLVRMCYALRPDGITWPEHENGSPSFRLEDLTAANGIEHAGAHDALVDVQATIALARRIRTAQPKLFDWALGLRDKTLVSELLNPVEPTPLVHTSSRIPAARGCTTLILPLAVVPDRKNAVVALDLMADPQPLLELDAKEIADRVFVATADLPEGVERIPLKIIASNKVPMLAPASTLRGVDTDRIGLDVERCLAHARVLQQHLADLRPRVMDVYLRPPLTSPADPDAQLYSGGFFSPRDRAGMKQILSTEPDQLGSREWHFDDARIPEMLFRFRGRNYPETFSPDEFDRWEKDRRARLNNPLVEGRLTADEFHAALLKARSDHDGIGEKQRLLDKVEAWAADLLRESP